MTANNRTDDDLVIPNDGYLWDGSGEPDPEIVRLERLLEQYRYDPPAREFPALKSQVSGPSSRRIPWFPFSAAIVAGVVGIAIAITHQPRPVDNATAAAGWDVARTAGSPRIGTTVIGEHRSNQLRIGEVLETDDHSRASLRSEQTGQIDVEPDTRLHLLTMETGRKWISLDRGLIHAFIWAPPGQFVVDTPSAVTVDLGCAYTLQVDNSGTGHVQTSMGWVGFKLNSRESFIPAGAACETRPKFGPGTPYFEDASPELRSALTRFDFEDAKPEQRARDLDIVLHQSRNRDALTLWHLLSRTDDTQRLRVYEKLARLAPPPAGVTRDGVLQLDQLMLDLWWNALGFDDIAVWRHWERSWAEASEHAAGK
jgi:hypothetical protein